MSSSLDYEVIMIFPDMDNATLEKAREEIKEQFSKRKASVTKMNEIGTKPLFHEKNHHKKGNFNSWNIKAEPASIKQITADLNVNTNVIKSMIVRVG